MKDTLMRLLPALFFIITGSVAIIYNKDYWEAASWFCFAAAILVTAFKPTDENRTFLRMLSITFMLIGIVLLILRVTGLLPAPVRPIPLI